MTGAAGAVIARGSDELTASRPPRVLCVDDDPAMTTAVVRILRNHYDVTPAPSAAIGLQLIRTEPPFAVVISDFQMPGMDGAGFLGQVRQLAPDTARILLTGRRDLAPMIAAVNNGQIFRFLGKPISPEALLTVVAAGCEQHRLATAEKELLEQTLLGSIKALISLLALAQPAALARTSRIKRYVSLVAERMPLDDRWSVEIAALLSHVGCVTLPPTTMDKIARGEALTSAEEETMARLPGVSSSLIAGIPRLERVRDILRFQDAHFDGSNSPDPATFGDAIPLGARILKVAMDFEQLETQGTSLEAAIAMMGARGGQYDPSVLAIAREAWRDSEHADGARDMLLSQVVVGMVFASDLFAPDGMLLAARGQEVTSTIVDRIAYDWKSWAGSRQVSMLVGQTRS